MEGKWQWVIMSYSDDRNLLGLRLIPLGVKEEREGRPMWLGDFSYSKLNCSNLPVVKLLSM